MRIVRCVWTLLVFVACGSAATKLENRAMADPDKAEKTEKTGKTLTFTVKEKSNELRLTKGDTLELKLEVRAGTGFGWEVAKNDAALLESKGKPVTVRIDEGKPGAAELQVFRFLAKAPGVTELELHYQRPFEKDQPPEKTFKLTIRIVEPG